MTLKTLKEKIKTLPAEKQEELNSLEVTVNYPHLNINKTLNGFVDMYHFVQKQYTGWEKLDEIPSYLEKSKKHFESIFKNLESCIASNFGKSSGSSFRSNLKEAIQNLEKDSNTNSRYYNNEKVFTYDATETVFLLQLYAIYPKSVETAIKFLIERNLVDIRLNFDNFIGIQKAFEFLGEEPEKTRVEAEAKSIQLLKDNFNKDIDNAEEKLENIIEKYDNWFVQTQEDFSDFDKQSKQTIKDKEELYTEKLKLEAPATYWRKRAEELGKEGKKWLNWLISTSILSVVLLGVVLFFISDGTLKEFFKESGSAIRWSIVFITFISFLAFGIRTFAKLMFSSYHLARDAEEREQLAYVYLALKKEQSIDDTERHLIMQSIFSRVDSGLLKSDTSPTMPGFLDKFMK